MDGVKATPLSRIGCGESLLSKVKADFQEALHPNARKEVAAIRARS